MICGLAQIGLRLLQIGLRLQELRPRGVQVRLRADLVFDELLDPAEGVAGIHDGRARLGDLRLGLIHTRLEGRGLDLREDLALLHPVVVACRQSLDPAGHLAADHHFDDRVDRSRGRYAGADVPSRHRRGAQLEPRIGGFPEEAPGERGARRDD